MSQPRCPFCNIYGLDNLKVENKSTFTVIYCGGCGAIHGVLPMVISTPPRPLPEISKEPDIVVLPEQTKEPPPITKTEIIHTPNPTPNKEISKNKIGAMVARGGYMALAYLPPLCPKCNIEMEKFTVPEGHDETGQQFWRCPNFQSCRQWQREG